MGITRLLIFFVIVPMQCQASCDTFFNNATQITLNDSEIYEKGAIIKDFSNDVNNETLVFMDSACDSILALNRSTLLLKENLLSESVCSISRVLCQWKCLSSISKKNSLTVIVNRISRGVFKFNDANHQVNVPESTSIGTRLYSFSDQDLSREDCISYSQAFFTIVGNQQYFYNRYEDGKSNIYLNDTLDYDGPQKIYHLNISAEVLDLNEVNYTTLTIHVTDVDDMDPVFDHDLFHLNITEMNTSAINVPLEATPRIHATDRDMGAGRQEVYYRFGDDSYTKGCFTIDKISGDITVNCTLDREFRDSYQFVLKAVQRNTESRSCTATLSINILDINDNNPEFVQTEYFSNITEHSAIGTSVVRLLATDLDKNPVIRYEIQPPYNDTFFAEENGDVRVKNPSKLDREIGSGTLFLKVKAFDGETKQYSNSTATVSITLLDINDKAPVFEKQEYVFPLPPEPNEGNGIGEIKAIDGDQANTPNSEVRYRLQHTMFSNLFSIHNKTGKLTLQKRPPSSTGVIELVVLAEDMGFPPLQSSAQILLSRTTVIGNTVNFTVPSSVEDVQSHKESIQQSIGKILGLTVSLDKIGEVENHKSMSFLIVSAKFNGNNSAVLGDILQSIILQHMGEILALFSNPEPQKLEAPQETFTPVVIALIAICALMLIGTIVLIAYIQNTTKRFKRYKQLHHHLTRQSSLYESQELKIEMPEEQTSDYNGSINGSQSLRNSNGELKEGVVSAFTNPAFIADETDVKITSAEEEAEQSLNDLANRLDAEESKVMIVDSYNPSESDVEVEPIRDYENTPTRYQDAIPNSYENVPHKFDSTDLPEDYPENDENKAEPENNTNKDGDDEDEPNPDYEVKAVRFSAQVLDTEENKFEPLREKDDKAESKKDEESGEELDSGANSDQDNEEPPKEESKNSEDDKDDDFGDGIENERTDEEIFSPNEVLQDENQTDEDNIPHFSFDTKM